MTESDNTPEVEETPVTEPAPVEVSPDEPTSDPTPDSDTPELNAPPVSGVPTPEAVSDVDRVNPNHSEDDNPEANVGDEVN